MCRARGVALILGMVCASLPQVTAAWYLEACARISASTPHELATQGAECMSSGEPSVQPSQLEADSRMITATYEELAASDRRTGSAIEGQRTLAGFARAWAEFRWRNQEVNLSAEALFRAAGYGKLTVRSDPPEAEIYVNDKKWEDPTNRSEWVAAGNKTVVLKKETCKVAEGSVDVPPGREATFERTLECTK